EAALGLQDHVGRGVVADVERIRAIELARGGEADVADADASDLHRPSGWVAGGAGSSTSSSEAWAMRARSRCWLMASRARWPSRARRPGEPRPSRARAAPRTCRPG